MPILRSKNNTTVNDDDVNRHQLMNANNPAMATGNAQPANYGHNLSNPPVNYGNNAASGRDAALIGAGGTAGPVHQSDQYDAAIPPTGVVSHGPSATSQTTGGSTTGQRLTGKVESALGSLVGSNALKTKGLQKEQEANSIKLQARELAEAERLEHEALMRRERAVAHGAHPSNSALGAGRAGTGASGPAGPGAGF